MPIDPNIALGFKGIQLDNPLDTATKVLGLKDLAMKSQAQQYQMQQLIGQRQAASQAMETDANGNTVMNPQKYKNAYAMLNPAGAMEENNRVDKMSLEDHANHINMRQDALQAYDGSDESWQKVRATQKAQGLDISMLPEQNPGQPFVDNTKQHLLGAEKQIAIKQKDQELDIQRQKAAIEQQQLGATLRKDFGQPMPAGAGQPTPGGELSQQNPADLVPNMPQHLQAKALDEIKAAQNTAQNAPKILEAFDNAANNIHGVDFVPGIQNADQKAMHALMGPTFQDVEGTVRQAAMDNMNENTTPQFGDRPDAIAKKRAALIGYLESKKAAPSAKAGGVDLSKFASTVADTSSKKDQTQVASQHSLQDLITERANRQKARTAANTKPGGNNN